MGHAVRLVANDFMNGKEIGGRTISYGLKENCVGIPEKNPNMDSSVYEAALKIEEKIQNGEIVPPYNKSTYDNFKA